MTLGTPQASEGPMTVFIYVNTSKQVGDAEHLKVFANLDAAETWFEENDPEGADVDLSLVRLPDDALIFPAIPGPGEDFSFTKPRDPRNFSKEFVRRAKRLGFDGFTFHHLRGTHTTLLLDRGVPVHTVAERIGDDPAVLLRNYAKRKRQRGDKPTMDASVSSVISALAAGFLSP
jgi:integrase